MSVAVHEAEGHLADLAAVQGDDAWLAWRWSARAALLRGRIAMLRDDVDGAVGERGGGPAGGRRGRGAARAARGRPSRGRSPSAARGIPTGVELVRAALERAESIGDEWLATTTRGVLDRVTVAP